MTNTDDMGDTLRKALAVPSDTMITLDLPLLLTKLSQVPVDRRSASHPVTPPGAPANDRTK